MGGDDADELDGALGGALEEEPTENGNKANDGLQVTSLVQLSCIDSSQPEWIYDKSHFF